MFLLVSVLAVLGVGLLLLRRRAQASRMSEAQRLDYVRRFNVLLDPEESDVVGRV